MEHLLSPARRHLAQLHGALGDDEKALARIARLERVLAPLQRARAAAPREPRELGRRDGAEIVYPAKRRENLVACGPRHAREDPRYPAGRPSRKSRSTRLNASG